MPFRKYDAAALARPEGAPHVDCQVRALATARGIPYDEAWELLYLVQGELRRCAFALVESLSAGDTSLRRDHRTLSYPAVRAVGRA